MLPRLRSAAKRFKVNTDGARLQDIRIHDLRRTMGSWQARTGASLIVIGKSLGHKSQQATAVYAHLDTDPVREAMEAATTAMLAAANKKPGASGTATVVKRQVTQAEADRIAQRLWEIGAPASSESDGPDLPA